MEQTIDHVAYAIYLQRVASGASGDYMTDSSLANQIMDASANYCTAVSVKSDPPLQAFYLFLKALTAQPSPDLQS